MIKLKDLLTLRELAYTDKIKPKHKKKMSREPKMLDINTFVKLPPPPDNDSNVTLGEIKYLASIEPDVTRVKEGDDIAEVFKKEIEHVDPKLKTDIDILIKDSVRYIMEIKYHYNRPRPFQIANFYGIDLNGTELDSMKTPSYPSGHATQGYLIGEYLALKDPKHAVHYRDVGEEIAESRIIAKAHYESDKSGGKKLAEQLMKFLS